MTLDGPGTVMVEVEGEEQTKSDRKQSDKISENENMANIEKAGGEKRDSNDATASKRTGEEAGEGSGKEGEKVVYAPKER